ncbi:sensor histidine kinase [Terrilactibacillus sp. S3-3]|nr:sensor histidine kinase [Terrilactibacillus sp. S3-3]
MRYAEKSIWMIAENEGSQTKIIVKNDGQSIPKQDMAAMFEPFRKGKKGQFGLGLAIVKRIVDHHGGRINVTNDEDGVAFVITLPMRKDRERALTHKRINRRVFCIMKISIKQIIIQTFFF